MKIEKNKVVSVNYHLTGKLEEEPAELIEQTSTEAPFVFLYGAGGMLEDFEKNLAGKAAGDAFDFHIKAEKAYGEHNGDYVAEIPKEAFHVEGKFDSERVKEGEELPMLDSEGHQMQGMVVEVGDKHVVMDFNHPLAGYDLHFVGSILDVREATEEELDHGHVHGPHGHHH
ncbi:MAG TPA: FKBP-type peptidyl-prolyl cis-trans isomerase [Bacteroidia bacterium]|jgi:FKBP-type peptidyl-prolyl cis-trans isomerase SlyD|nr:FKBP-type peptidyl-prolyl cis-trans isomerase [Bacteroidia bacterium]